MFSYVKICLSVYISLMTSGKFVRLYSLSVGQGCDEHQKGSCVLHIFRQYFRISRIIDFLDFNLHSDYYLNVIYINYC